jgi:hypothetical protein
VNGADWVVFLSLTFALADVRGELWIRCRTVGAKVAVDGEIVGTLPLDAPLRLRPGQHTVKITKRGFTDYLDVAVVKAHKRTSLDIDLLPVSGVARVRASVPDVQVFVDGRFVGMAGEEPLEADLPAGKRSLRAAKAGYRDFFSSIEAVAGETYDVRATLEPLRPGEAGAEASRSAVAWYDHWYVWAGAAALVVAIVTAVAVPGSGPSSCQDLHGDLCYDLRR